jgi:hypothetical protein
VWRGGLQVYSLRVVAGLARQRDLVVGMRELDAPALVAQAMRRFINEKAVQVRHTALRGLERPDGGVCGVVKPAVLSQSRRACTAAAFNFHKRFIPHLTWAVDEKQPC